MRTTVVLCFATALVTFNASADEAAGKQKAEVCAACHGADGNSVNPIWPNLAGQTARYIYLQLRDFKEGRRKNDLMSPMAANLSREDMQDLAAYFSSQTAKPTRFICFAASPSFSSPIVVSGRSLSAPRHCAPCTASP